MSEPPSLLPRLRLNPAAEDVVGLGSPFSPFGLFRSATRLFTSQSSLPLLSSPRSTKEPRMGKKKEKEGGGGAAPTNNPLPLFSLPSFGMLVFFHRFRSPFLHFFICYFLSLFSLRTRVRYLREACGERKTPIRVGSLSDCLQKLCDSPPNPSS